MKKSFKFVVIVIGILLIALVGGCGLTGSPEKKGLDGDVPPVDPQPTKEVVELTLYFSDDQAMYLKPETRTVSKDGKPLADLLVEELVKGPTAAGLGKTIPEGTKLLSLEVVDGVAFVNFSKEVMTNHWGGSSGETMTTQSVAVTLAQLPEVEKVQFLVEGKKEESIWGHGYTGEPIDPQRDLIAK